MLNKEKELLLQLLIEKYHQKDEQKLDVKTTTTKQNRSRAQQNCKRWTVDECHILAVMHADNKTHATVARRLRRSKKSVQTMTSKMFGNNAKDVPVINEFWSRFSQDFTRTN